ncbi:MAG: carbamoyltransferase C-terminal domain-containing protein [Candidatus Lernaella stagnicola]|nr:carbamoyltransferase C-terminal domain-containing protein [Candidatus Lernaella stagnicola]
MSRLVLGFNAHIHDTAAAILVDGRLAAFAEEERFRRQKHTTAFPEHAIAWCLREVGATINDLTGVGFYWKPWLGLGRRIGQTLAGLPGTLRNVRRMQAGNLGRMFTVRRDFERRYGYRGMFAHVNHYLAHAYHAAFESGFDRSLVLIADGNGEIATTLAALHEGETITPLRWTYYPHSLGLLWCTATEFLGYRQNSDEGKVMGLAPYGDDALVPAMRQVVRHQRGRVRLDMGFFDYHLARERWFSDRWVRVFGPPRAADEPLNDRHRAVARAVQEVTEEILLEMLDELLGARRLRHLAMAGGVALNCVANGRIAASGLVDDLYIPPAAYDAGAAVGAAMWLDRELLGARGGDVRPGPFTGPGFDDAAYERALCEAGLSYRRVANIETVAAQRLAAGKIVGWFQGRMESGPRALGHRSILADPRDPSMKDHLNSRVKHREPYRPFGPSVLAERAAEIFETDGRLSPFMLTAVMVQPTWRERIPAVVHVDGSSRLQTVDAGAQPRYHRLIAEFDRLTGVPVLLNTSFNVMGEPIVCTPRDAIACFRGTGIDVLVLGDFLVDKEAK